MRVLVICDDYWHPARTVREGLAPLSAPLSAPLPGGDFSFDFIENAGDWSASRMADYPLVILSKSDNISAADQSSWMTAETQAAFVDYVSRGGGLFAIHSGIAGYEQAAELRALLGGVFIQHPPQCLVTIEPKPGHPLTAESSAFTAKDEHYHVALDDAMADVFLTSASEHGSQPAGWMRSQGKGRVCVLTPGHNLEVWTHPSFQSLLRKGMNWCAKERI